MKKLLLPTPIPSSQINRIGYSETDRVLLVEFKGTGLVYCYHDCLRNVFEKCLKSKSIGNYISKEIIPNHYGKQLK